MQIVLTVLTGWFALQIYSVGDGKIWRLFAGLAVCSSLSIVFRTGWLIPCTVLGTVIGVLLDPPIKGGDAESEMWETVQFILSGTVVGLIVGLLADLMSRKSSSNAKEQGNVSS